MNPALLILVILFASFTQGAAGFGLGLVAMPFLIEPLGVQPSTSLVALIAVFVRIVMLIVYREAINLRIVTRIAVASLVGLPIGVLVLQRLNSGLVLTVLGVVVVGYALYSLLNLRLPEVVSPLWAYGAGFLSGLLSGAYNTGGPPVIMYGASRRWGQAEFKSNLQGIGLVNSVAVISLHFVAHDFTPLVLADFVRVFPVVAVGLLLGMWLTRYFNPFWFRRLVLVVLVVVGLNLIF
jgi:uncharacterized protein